MLVKGDGGWVWNMNSSISIHPRIRLHLSTPELEAQRRNNMEDSISLSFHLRLSLSSRNHGIELHVVQRGFCIRVDWMNEYALKLAIGRSWIP